MPARKRRTSPEIEALRMEAACEALGRVVADLRKHKAVTPESVAMITSAVTTIALLEREIGRRLTGSLSPHETPRAV